MTGFTQFQIRLFRDSFNTPWGFRLQGGKDLNQALVVQRVFSNSPAEGELQRGDHIISIGERRSEDLTHKQAKDLIEGGGGQIHLAVTRPPGGRHELSHPNFRTPAPVAPRTNVPKAMPHGSSHGKSAGHQPSKVNLSKLGGGGPDFGSDYTRPHTVAPPQVAPQSHSYRPSGAQGGQMLNRVQESLDTIIGAPSHQQPQYEQPPFFSSPAPAPPFQPNMSMSGVAPQQFGGGGGGGYTPTFEKIDSGQYAEEQEFMSVWERRRTYQEGEPAAATSARSTSIPKVPRPVAYHPDAPSYGLDFNQPLTRSASVTWKPQQVQVQAQVQAPQQPGAPIQTEPPKYKNEAETISPWRQTLRKTGVKPWDIDLDYGSQQPTPRSGAFNPLGDSEAINQYEAVNHFSPAPADPAPAWDGGQQVNGEVADVDDPSAPNFVHLQYNSPMSLYSKANVKETLDGQKQASGFSQPPPQQIQIQQQQSAPQQQSSAPKQQQQQQQQPSKPLKEGDRDWSDSAVYRMIQMEEKRGPAPPKQHQPQQQQQQQQQQQPQQHQYNRVAAPRSPVPRPAVSPVFQQAPTQYGGAPSFEDELGVSDF